LDVSVAQFRRTWEEICQEVQWLFALDQDWASTPPVIHFERAIKDPNFLQAGANLRRGAEELLELLATHPGTALDRPGKEAPSPGRKQRGSLSRDQVNERVIEYLQKNLNAKSPQIAKQIGCSEANVRKTAAWKVVARRRKQK